MAFHTTAAQAQPGNIQFSAHTAAPHATSALIVVLFIAVLLPPIYFNIGSTTLSLSRLFLLLSIVPLFLRLLSGQAGRLMASDYLILVYCGWIAVTYIYHYGTERTALAGITIIEQLGAYLVGRVLIRNVTDYTIFVRAYFIALLVLFPFAFYELFTGRNLWAAIFDPIFSTHVKGQSAYGRMGLERVMSGFEHPILFGLFCSLGISNFFYVYQPKQFKAISMIVFAAGMTFMSLSSAPLIAAASQTLLIAWDKITSGRWILLSILAVIAYVTVDLLSNRTPVTILISTLTFNPLSAWIRVSIWDYGYAAVLANPIMGIGLGDWPRPFWLTSSVDNFWLLTSMRHGVPAIALLLAALAWHFAAIVRNKTLSPTLARYRTGYILALLSLYFSLCTVHVWGGTSSFVFFYIGAGLWFAQAGAQMPEPEGTSESPGLRIAHPGRAVAVARRGPVGTGPGSSARPAGLRHSRFPAAHKRGDRKT